MTEYDVDYETSLRRKYLTPRAQEKFDRWLNEIRAEAWDEGFDAGEADVFMHEAAPEGYDGGCIENPYRPNEK